MFKMLSILLCCLLAIVCYKQAKSRGRRPFAWFLIGLLFCFFGLISLLLLPPLPARPKQKGMAPPQPPKKKPLHPLEELHQSRLWYYLDRENTQYGPMSLDALSDAWHAGKIEPTTYVWHEALENWSPLQEVLKPS